MAAAPSVVALDSAARMNRVAQAISEGQHSFARTLLEPVLLHPRIDSDARALSYHYLGVASALDGLDRSAAIAWAIAIDFDPAQRLALNALAFAYLRGKGTAIHRETALDLYLRAAEIQHIPSMISASLLLLDPASERRDLGRARRLLDRAAGAGSPAAMLLASRAWGTGDAELAPDPKRAAFWANAAARQGSALDGMNLDFLASPDTAGPADLAAAMDYFQVTAGAAEAAAQAALAFMLLIGDSDMQDQQAARHWYRQAAEAHDWDGAAGYAYVLDQGIGGPMDQDAAKDWYQRAAANGSARAEQWLGLVHYQQGEFKEAAKWLSRAAAGGSSVAQNALAWLLATSTADGIRDGERAIEWATEAVATEPAPAYIDTLAAAYAEAGRFDEAISTQQRALAVLAETNPEVAREFRQRLANYSAGQPWREQAADAP